MHPFWLHLKELQLLATLNNLASTWTQCLYNWAKFLHSNLGSKTPKNSSFKKLRCINFLDFSKNHKVKAKPIRIVANCIFLTTNHKNKSTQSKRKFHKNDS